MPLKVVKLLNRQLAWTEQGFEWHADTKHSRSVLLKHGLVEGKSTSAVSPGSKASGMNIRDGEDYLGVHEAKDLALSRFGPSGLAVHGGSVDVGNHEAAAKTPGHDEALLEVYGRATVLRLEIRLPRVARRDCDLD